jgi:hypothetical protein
LNSSNAASAISIFTTCGTYTVVLVSSMTGAVSLSASRYLKKRV